MAARPTVSAEDVAHAVAELVAAGEPVTGWRLRRIIGAGNPGRLEALAREQAAAGEGLHPGSPEPETLALPPSLAEQLAEAENRLLGDLRAFAGHAWTRASDVAARRVEEEVSSARQSRDSLEAELAEAGSVIAASDEREAALIDELATANAALAAADQARRAAAMAAEVAAVRLEDIRATVQAAEGRAEAAERRAEAADARLSNALAAIGPVNARPAEAALQTN